MVQVVGQYLIHVEHLAKVLATGVNFKEHIAKALVVDVYFIFIERLPKVQCVGLCVKKTHGTGKLVYTL